MAILAAIVAPKTGANLALLLASELHHFHHSTFSPPLQFELPSDEDVVGAHQLSQVFRVCVYGSFQLPSQLPLVHPLAEDDVMVLVS